MPRPPARAIICDLFGTIVGLVTEQDFRDSLPPTAAALGVTPRVLAEAWCTYERFTDWMTRNDTPADRIGESCEALGITVTPQALAAAAATRFDAHRRWLEPLPMVTQTLGRLKNAGVKLGLMSVCSSEVGDLWHETAFAELFDVVNLSCACGLTKGDEAFYRDTLALLEVDAASTTYVGDSREELQWAARLGMQPVQVRTAKRVDWDGPAVDSVSELIGLV